MIKSLRQFTPTSRAEAAELIQRLWRNSLLRNSVLTMSTTVVLALLGYVFWIVAAKSYTTHDMGLASAAISIMTLTSSLCGVGLVSTMVQDLPQRSNGLQWSRTLNAAILVGCLSSIAAGAVTMFILPQLSPELAVLGSDAWFTTTFIAGVLLLTLTMLLDGVFTAERISQYGLVRNFVFALLKIVFLFPFVFMYNGTTSIVASSVLASAASMVVGMYFVLRLNHGYQLAYRGLLAEMRSMTSSFVGHHLISIGGRMPMYILPVLVAMRLSPVDNAYFYATWMLGGIFFMIAPSIAIALFAEGSHNANAIQRNFRAAVKIIGAMLSPIILIFLFGGHLILGLFGHDYVEHGTTLLLILTISSIPDAITVLYISVMRVRKQLNTAAALNLSMAAGTLALAWFLMPSFGITGAGLGWLIAKVVGTVFVVAQSLRRAPIAEPSAS